VEVTTIIALRGSFKREWWLAGNYASWIYPWGCYGYQGEIKEGAWPSFGVTSPPASQNVGCYKLGALALQCPITSTAACSVAPCHAWYHDASAATVLFQLSNVQFSCLYTDERLAEHLPLPRCSKGSLAFEGCISQDRKWCLPETFQTTVQTLPKVCSCWRTVLWRLIRAARFEIWLLS